MGKQVITVGGKEYDASEALAALVTNGIRYKKDIDTATEKLKAVKDGIVEAVRGYMQEHQKGTATIIAGPFKATVSVPSVMSIDEEKAIKLSVRDAAVYERLITEKITYKPAALLTKVFAEKNPWIWEYIEAKDGNPSLSFERVI